MLESKRAQVERLVASGDYKKALQICKEWNYSNPTYCGQLRLGYECLMYPDFYRQLGRDPDEEYNKAVDILRKVYLNENPLEYD